MQLYVHLHRTPFRRQNSIFLDFTSQVASRSILQPCNPYRNHFFFWIVWLLHGWRSIGVIKIPTFFQDHNKIAFRPQQNYLFLGFNPYLRVMWRHKNLFVSHSRITHSSHLYYGRAFWLVLGHRFPVNSLRTLRIVVVQVRDIYRDRCGGL